MNNEVLKEMPEYVKNLPKEVQDFVFNSAWEERVDEISKKYTLNTDQTENLKDDTVLLLIGLEKPNAFIETIINDLGISRLLAEQIVEEIDNRVFELALKTIEKKSKPNDNTSIKIENKIPEIRPENLPVEPKNVLETKHDILKTQENLRVLKEEKTETYPATKPKSVQKEVNIGKEFVQRPHSVPRFTAEPLDAENDTEIQTPPTEEKPKTDILQNKLGNVTKSNTEAPKEAPKKYSVDPYREPLE